MLWGERSFLDETELLCILELEHLSMKCLYVNACALPIEYNIL